MGIKSLHKFLQRHTPSVYVYKPIADYRGFRVAVDMNLYLYVHKSRSKKNWFKSFFQMLLLLRQNELKLVAIYDTQAPPEKYAKQQQRKDRRSSNELRVRELTQDLANYQQRGMVTDLLKSVMDKNASRYNLLSNSSDYIDEQIILSEIDQIQGQIIHVTKHDVVLSRQMLESLSIPIFDAPTEAETFCAHLCYHNYVDAVLSNDTDVLVYRTKHFLTKLDTTNMTVIDLQFDDLIQRLGLTAEQFIDFCIMCETDYNPNMKRIGPEKAYKLIKQYGSLEAIRDNTKHDTSVLNFERVREIFSIPETLDVTIDFQDIDEEKMNNFQNYYNTNNTLKPMLNFKDVVSAFEGETHTKFDEHKSDPIKDIKHNNKDGNDQEERSPILRPESEDDPVSGNVWHKVGSRKGDS